MKQKFQIETQNSNLFKKKMEENTLNREIKFFGHKISIKQEFSGELGATVWDAALVLIKYFENLEEFPMTFWQGKQVLELGAGTGIISIALALLGCN